MPLTRQWQHGEQVRSLLAQIPSDASVSASRYILTHVSDRRAVLPFARYPRLRFINDEGKAVTVDYIIADLWFPQQYQTVFKDARSEVQQTLKELDQVLSRSRYGIVDFKDGVLLMQKDQPSKPEAEAAWRSFRGGMI
jgi:hypothetical protein